MAYVIKETNSVNADRTATTTVNGSLSSAKRVASRSQVFKGTVMKIEDTMGRLVSYKKENKWTDL